MIVVNSNEENKNKKIAFISRDNKTIKKGIQEVFLLNNRVAKL